eukprot:PhM_4_TR4864/c0_g1_i1/m.66247
MTQPPPPPETSLYVSDGGGEPGHITSSSDSSSVLGFSIPMDWVLSDVTTGIAVLLSFLTVCLSVGEIVRHARRYDYPHIQRHILRILFMMPIYALDSSMAMVFPKYSLYLNTLRDVYESFVLYQFIALLICYGGGEVALVRALNSKQYKGRHLFPFCRYYFRLNRSFLITCKRGVLQYCFFKTATAIGACILHPFGFYVEGDMNWLGNSYPWFFIVNNISISISLYYLLLFGVELDKEFAKYRPVLKFTAIKAVIFFAFWQGAMLVVLQSMGVIQTSADEEQENGDVDEKKERVGVATQDFLICVELVPICVLMIYTYGRNALQNEVDDIRVYEERERRRVSLSNSSTSTTAAGTTHNNDTSTNSCALMIVSSPTTTNTPPACSPVSRPGTFNNEHINDDDEDDDVITPPPPPPLRTALKEVVAVERGVADALDLNDCVQDTIRTFGRQKKEGGLLEHADAFDEDHGQHDHHHHHHISCPEASSPSKGSGFVAAAPDAVLEREMSAWEANERNDKDTLVGQNKKKKKKKQQQQPNDRKKTSSDRDDVFSDDQ